MILFEKPSHQDGLITGAKQLLLVTYYFIVYVLG